MPKIYPVIMCGGAGTRLWPLSRKSKPKQFHALSTKKSMLRETMARSNYANGLDVAAPSFVCALDHESEVKEQCAQEDMSPLRLILEPCARNTAAVAAVVAMEFNKLDPDGLVLLLPADQHVDQPAALWQAVASGVQAASGGYLTTFGIAPDRPETGYGYIKQGARLDDGAVIIDRFVEKPDLETARSYLSSGDYFWNGGIFLFSPAAMMSAFEQHAPDIMGHSHKALEAARKVLPAIYLDPASFAACRSDSIDYAIMEQADKRALVPGVKMGWSDIGSWEVIAKRALAANKQGVSEIGNVMAIDCDGSYLRSEGPLVAAIGLKDVVVVANEQSILITALDQSQKVKTIVTRLKDDGRQNLL